MGSTPTSTPVNVARATPRLSRARKGRALSDGWLPLRIPAVLLPAIRILHHRGSPANVAMLERCVTDIGGSWAFCDTDSMAIVATENGGPIPCAGGATTTGDGGEALWALTPAQVLAIRNRFGALNPYDPGVVADVLKEEDSGTCYAISAKRYAIYRLDEVGFPVFVQGDKLSRHGLGHFLNPGDLGAERNAWIKELWQVIILRAHDQPANLPLWSERPTLVQTSVTSPAVLRAFRHINDGLPYACSIKPFNFMLTAAGARPRQHPAWATVPAGRTLRNRSPEVG